MKLDIEHNGKVIKSVNVEMTPTEFMIFRQILNLTAVHTELHEVDSLIAGRMYKDIDEYLKEIAK